MKSSSRCGTCSTACWNWKPTTKSSHSCAKSSPTRKKSIARQRSGRRNGWKDCSKNDSSQEMNSTAKSAKHAKQYRDYDRHRNRGYELPRKDTKRHNNQRTSASLLGERFSPCS